MATLGMMEFAGHVNPARQSPLHSALGSAVTLPNLPAGHDTHTVELAVLYFPAGHTTDVALVDPAAHVYPARHGPEHVDTTRPVVFPK
jgi:hypothetical protein